MHRPLRCLDVAIAAFFLLLVLTDLLASLWPPAAAPGALLWFFANLLLCGLAVFALVSALVRAQILSVLAFGLYAWLFYLTFVDPRNVSHEATQEIACVLRQIGKGSDFGFRSSCFLHYPTRQYYLPAAPTLAFGPSQGALNFGMMLYLFVGMACFLGGLTSIFRDRLRGDLVALVALLLLLHVGWFNYQFLSYEQAILPLGFSLIITGLFLYSYAYPTRPFLTLAALAAYMSIFSYTPSLALVVITVILLIGIACIARAKLLRAFSALSAVALVVGFRLSLAMRDDLHLLSRTADSTEGFLAKLAELRRVLVAPDSLSNGLVTPLLGILILVGSLMLLVSLPFQAARWRQIWRSSDGSAVQRFKNVAQLASFQITGFSVVIAFWAIGVILVSVLAPGYAKPPVPFAIHRAMIIFPPLFAIMALWIERVNQLRFGQLAVLIAILGLTAHRGISGFFRLYEKKVPNQNLLLLHWIDGQFPSPQAPIHIFFSKNLRTPFANLRDYSVYFGARVRYNFIFACENIPRLRRPNRTNLIVHLAQHRFCEHEMQSAERRYRAVLNETTYEIALLE